MDWVIGFLVGVLTGLIPGLHINTIANLFDNPYIILGAFGSQLVISFLPALLFSLPDDTTLISPLPGGELIRKGKGVLAVRIVALSSFLSLLLSLSFFPFLSPVYGKIFNLLRGWIPYLLVVFLAFLIIRSSSPLTYVFFLTLSGLLGEYALSLSLNDPFLPLFSGFFAVPVLLSSTFNTNLPSQRDSSLPSGFLSFVFWGWLVGFLSVFLPGISSPGQMATFLSFLSPTQELYLATLPAISVSQGFYSMVSMATVNKARSGAVAKASAFLDFSLYLFPALLSYSLSVFFAFLLLYFFRHNLFTIPVDFSLLARLILIYLFFLTIYVDGYVGGFILFLSSITGYIAMMVGVERTSLMGAVIVPTLLFYFS